MLANAWRWLHSTLGRGLAGIVALVTLAWFLWPEPQWHVHPDALCALVIALAAWVASLAPVQPQAPSKHDVELLTRFRALLSESEKDFLRTYDLANSFSWHRLEGTQELSAAWHGAEFEFDDHKVQDKLSPILETAREFIHRLALGTWPIGPERLSSAIPKTEIDDKISQKTWDRIQDFNKRATALADAIDEFIKFARKRLCE
jgi:hypothetical protein